MNAVFTVAIPLSKLGAHGARIGDLIFPSGNPVLVLSWNTPTDGQRTPSKVETLNPLLLQKINGGATDYLYSGPVAALDTD